MSLSSTQVAYLGQLAAQISPDRLTPYLRKEGNDPARALARYYWNAELGRSFYPPLQALEIALRNNLDGVIAKAFPIDGRRRNYLDVPSWIDRTPRVAVHPGAEGQIAHAKDAILRRLGGGWEPDARRRHGDLLAATTFGFWTGLLSDTYSAPAATGIVLWNRTEQWEKIVFPSAAGETLTSIRTRFTAIRHFRNRVFHHEPLWPKRDDDPTPQERYDDILEALRWLGGPQARVPGLLHKRPEALDQEPQLKEMHRRLIETVDRILGEAAAKAAEKEAKKAARKARQDEARVAKGEIGPGGRAGAKAAE